MESSLATLTISCNLCYLSQIFSCSVRSLLFRKPPTPSTTITDLLAMATNASAQTKLITCHCKAVRVTFPPLREPANECLCSICRRYGALWAYYKPDEVKVEGETEAYIWGKKRLAYNRCKNCGCMTHYSIVKPEETEPRVAVNCRMMEREEYDRLESEQSDGD